MHKDKEDLALNNLQRLICQKTKPNYTIQNKGWFITQENVEVNFVSRSNLVLILIQCPCTV